MKCLSKICIVVICLLLLFTWTMPAFATGSNVVFDGEVKDFVIKDAEGKELTNLFTSFSNVMPGDKLTQTITIHNESKETIELYIRALETEEVTDDFLSQLKLTVYQGDKKLSEDSADETAGLTKDVKLGVVNPGKKIELTVVLEVPITLGNEFQGAAGMGILSWQFKANQYIPKDPSVPQTGDTVNPAVYMTVMALCAVLIILLILFKRKKKEE